MNVSYMNKLYEEKKSNTMSSIKVFNLMFMSVFVIFFFCTFLSAYLDGIILYGLTVLWFWTAMMIDTKWLTSARGFIFALFVYFVIILCDNYIQGTYKGLEDFVKSNIYFFVFMLMGVFYSCNKDKFDLKPVLALIFIVVMISYIATYAGLSKYPNASRDLASGINPMCDTFKKMGIGGFGFIYQTPYLIIAIIFIFNQHLNVWKALLLFGAIVLMSYTVVKSQYTTATITVVAAIGLSLIFVSNKNNRTKIIILIFLIMLIALLRVQLLEFILKIYPDKDGTIWMRLNELLQSMIDDSESEFNRIAIMKKSLEAFLNNPIIGEMGKEKSIGGHSDFVDMLGQFGLIGFVVYNAIYYYAAKTIYKNLRSEKLKIAFIILQVILLLNRLTNPMYSAQSVSGAAFLLAPLVLFSIDKPSELMSGSKEKIQQIAGVDSGIAHN